MSARGHAPQLLDEPVGFAVVAAIEVGPSEEVGLVGVRLVIQEVLRDELLDQLIERRRIDEVRACISDEFCA